MAIPVDKQKSDTETSEDRAHRHHSATTSRSRGSLTHAQHDESWRIAGILEREIWRSGRFAEKLGDYAYVFSRNEKFDVAKSEEIIRAQFKARYGANLNEYRKTVAEREERLDGTAVALAFDKAKEIEARMKADGDPFYRAFDAKAVELSKALDVTESKAKSLMKSSFAEETGKDLYAWAKSFEAQPEQRTKGAPKVTRRRER